MRLAKDWKDYEILDMASGMKLERWGDVILNRPDPQIVWNEKTNKELWKNVNAKYIRSNKGGGHWENITNVKESWQIKYKDLTFNIKQMGFKHTGLFPEQAVNWDYMIDKIKNSNRKIKVLNLFAYTGGATVACAYAGADVVHVDASRGMVDMAKDNIKFMGRLSDEEITSYYAKSKAFIFPGEEDFGITPIEAQASGTPVIAYGRGGALDTVVDGKSGVLFHEQSVDALVEAVRVFEKQGVSWNAEQIKNHTQQFSLLHFQTRFKEYVKQCIDNE